MQKNIDLNKHNILNLFSLIWFVLKKKPLLVFSLFLMFSVLSSLILVHNDKIYFNELNSVFHIYIYLALLILGLCLYPLLMLSVFISFGQILAKSKTFFEFQEKVNNLNLKSCLISNMTRALGHILSLIVFLIFVATLYRLIAVNIYFSIPSIALILLFLYAYIRILAQVISSNGFWQAFSAIWSIVKPSIFFSLWTTKYLITTVFSLLLIYIVLKIPILFTIFEDASFLNIMGHAFELSFYTMTYILFLSFATALLKNESVEAKNPIEKLIISMVVLLIIGFSSYITWKKHEVKTLLSLGDTYTDMKEYDTAIETYNEVLEIEPLTDEAYCSLGYTHTLLKEYFKASESYLKYLKINPSSDNCFAYENLLELQLIQNLDFNKTIEEKCIELDQDEKEYFIIYEMLKIMDKIVKGENVDLEEWSKKYEGIKSEWEFQELRTWVSSMDEGEKKEKLFKALNTFEEHDTL